MGDLENKKYWIWLSLIKNLGSKRKLKLLELYNNIITNNYLGCGIIYSQMIADAMEDLIFKTQ